MPLRFGWVTIDSEDPDVLATFWKEALDFQEIYRSDEGEEPLEIIISEDAEGAGWTILLIEVHDDRKGKNRLHFDLRPDDQEAEVARLEGLGAKRIDIGQGETNWTVMSDPEGNEFCVLRPRTATP
ncbi:MAG: hypothetical protein QOG54_965 [Actinomycetota bacterium]|jgi:predicted enzyme related to lactoylglutathione lyase|nr:hypothetical protein [Actinomycetota bacterium]